MSVSVGTNEQRIKAFYLSNKKKQGLKYLNTKRVKTHHRPCCADLCMRMDLPLDKKLWKIRTGPPGRGRPWAAGCGAAGPLGRGGPWVAGLLLAKPVQRVDSTNHWMNHSPMGNSIGFGSIYAMDPTFQQLGPDVLEHYL